MRRGRQNDPLPGGLEGDVLASLWRLGQATVAAVQLDLEDRFEYEYAYTTVLTVLRRLERKGWAARSREGQAHIYGARLDTTRVQAGALDRLRNSLFGGSHDLMIAMLREDRLRCRGLAGEG